MLKKSIAIVFCSAALYLFAVKEVKISKQRFKSMKERKTLDSMLKARAKNGFRVRVKSCTVCSEEIIKREQKLRLFVEEKPPTVGVSSDLLQALRKGGVCPIRRE